MKPALVTSLVSFATFALALPRSEATLSLQERQFAGCKPISPPPSGLVCGGRGNLTNWEAFDDGHRFAGHQYLDLQTCRNWCLQRTNPPGLNLQRACVSFAYEHNTRRCSFFDAPFTTFKAAQGSSGELWDARCFDCPQTCPQTGTTNLIGDGGFELNGHYRGPFSNAYKGLDVAGKVTSPGFNSNRAQHCNGTYCQLLQYRLMCPGQKYILEMEYKVDPGTQSPDYRVSVGDALYSTRVPTSGTGGWRHLAMTFKALFPLELLTIDYDPHCATCPQYGYADNVVVRPYPSAVPAGTRVAFTNPGFEGSSLPPWTLTRLAGTTGTTSFPAGLAGSAHAFQYASDPSVASDHVRLSHPLPALTLHRRYRLQFRYRLRGDVDLRPAAAGSLWDELEPPGARNYVNASARLPQGSVQLFQRLFTAGDASGVPFTLDVFKRSGGEGTVAVDDFEVAALA